MKNSKSESSGHNPDQKSAADYIAELKKILPDNFSSESGNGLPEAAIGENDVLLPGLVILSGETASGFYFRTKQQHEAYLSAVRRNQELALQGKFSEVSFFDPADAVYPPDELQAELNRLKQEALKDLSSGTGCYMEVFLELDYPKARTIAFLTMLRQLGIMYKQVY